MRDKLNNNPLAQVAVVGVLLVVGGFMVMKMMKKDEPAPAPTLGADGTEVVATGAGAAPPSDPAAAAATTPVASTTDPAAAAAASASATGALPVVPGPPLPPAVESAHAAGKVVVLLAVRGGGLDDRLLRQSVSGLRDLRGISVFTTRASGIARYARITQSVNLDRVPALIVIQPRSGGAAPTAEVRYGFRSAKSVVQAVRDVLYRGPTVGYSPD